MTVIDPVDRRSGVPAYRQLADQIRGLIASGAYPPGSALPPEPELAEASGLNRTSVRNAIKILRAAGLVDAFPGRGTYVRSHRLIRRYVLEGLRTEHAQIGKPLPPDHTDLWSAMTGTTARVEVTSAYSNEAATPDLADAFGANETAELPLLCRRYVFTVDGQPHQVFRSWLRRDMVDGTSAADPTTERPDQGTMAQLAAIGVHVTSVDMSVRVRMPNPEEARTLDIGDGTPVYVMRRVMFSADAQVEVGESVVPGDRVELAFRLNFTDDGQP